MKSFTISSIIIIATNLPLSIIVYLRGKERKVSVPLSLFLLSATIWGIGCLMISITQEGARSSGIFWWQVAYIGTILAVPFFTQLTVSYLNLDKRHFVRAVYTLAVIYLLFNWYNEARYFWGDVRYVFGQYYCIDVLKYKNISWFLFYISFYWIVLGYLFLLLLSKFKGSEGAERTRLKYFILAIGLGWLGTEPLYLPAFHIDFYMHSNFLVAVYPMILTYAILRHHVIDIEIIIKRTLVFAGLFACIYTVFAFFAFLGQIFFERFVTSNRWISMIPSVIAITIMLRPLENFLINVTNKYLFQKKYDYKELLKTFTTEVLTVLDLNNLVNLTADKLTDIVKLNSCSILLFDNDKQRFNVIAWRNIKDASVTLLKVDEVVTFLEQTQGYLLKKEFNEKKILIPDTVQAIMDKLNSELLVPMILQEKLIGILSLGKKKSDEYYTQDDLDIILPLARTLAIAISNAELFEELGKTQAEAAQREKMAVIGTLSAGINHEICNPLGIARGQCEAFLLNIKDGLYKNKTTEELLRKAEEIMGKVIKETDRATAITKKLSGFAKPAKGEAELIDISKEIDEVFGLVGYELRLEKIEFEKNLESNLPKIVVDRKQFQEVLFNLMRNAGQAIGEKGKITVSAIKDKEKVVIDIQDTGSGIPQEKIKELFNPFFTTKEPGKGTGLGLFIVRQVVEKNNGRIYLKKTKVGEGTTFSVEFPEAGAANPQTTRA